MTFADALRATEILLALAFLQQSAEHIFGREPVRTLFLPRLILACLLLAGVQVDAVLLALTLHSLLVLHHYRGAYNGGSDRMSLLVLYCLCLAHWLPTPTAQEVAFGYLAVQLTLSYFVSGQVKLMNPDWRSGQALQDVFAFSAYPVTENLRGLVNKPRLLWIASWAVILFEVLFPLTLVYSTALMAALCMGLMFHLANAVLFGLNRFVLAWVAAYPSILWFQGRLTAAL